MWQVWRDALREKQASPYMSHTLASSGLRSLCFVPYEDVLGIGHGGGVGTMLVPGARGGVDDVWRRGCFGGLGTVAIPVDLPPPVALPSSSVATPRHPPRGLGFC